VNCGRKLTDRKANDNKMVILDRMNLERTQWSAVNRTDKSSS